MNINRRHRWLFALLVLALIAGDQNSRAGAQPVVLTTTGASNQAIVFPDASQLPSPPQLEATGLPSQSEVQGASYFGSDRALLADEITGNIYVLQVSTDTVLDTINSSAAGYSGGGTIAVSPDQSVALASGVAGDTIDRNLYVVHAPFGASSVITTVSLEETGHVDYIEGEFTQSIVFNRAGRAFVYKTEDIAVLDPPYTSIAFTIPLPFYSGGSIAITPDGNTLLVTDGKAASSFETGYTDHLYIFSAPFSASSTPAILTLPGLTGLDGIAVTPDGTTALAVDSGDPTCIAVSAPFSSSSTVQTLPLPSGLTVGFEDVGISADGQVALLAGEGVYTDCPAVFLHAPFTTAGVQSYAVPIQNSTSTERGGGAARFRPTQQVSLDLSASASVATGSSLIYTLTYSNYDSVPATGVIIKDALPAGTSFVSAGNGGTFDGTNVVFSLSTVAAGVADQTLTFTVNVTAASGATIFNGGDTIQSDAMAATPGTTVTTAVTGTSGPPAPTPTPTPTPTPPPTPTPTPTPSTAAPVITSAATAAGDAGAAFSYQITASNTPVSFSADPLPAGLSFDATTGLISGTPTAVGTFPITMGATNAAGTGAATLTLTLLPAITITSNVPLAYAEGSVPGQFTVTRTGDTTAPLVFSYTIKGTAVNGDDYSRIKKTKTIKAGKAFKHINIVPTDESYFAGGKRTVKLILKTSPNYAITGTGSAKVKIQYDQ